MAGNPDGDITIVEYFDYNCPYCRKVEPELRQVVQDDGKVRLVLKDWPILGPVSVVAARMALACKYQDKYRQAHQALIGVASKLTEPRIRELLAARASMSTARRAISPPTPRTSTRSGAQQRTGHRVRIQGHAVVYRRQVSRAGRADHGTIRASDRRCAQGGEKVVRNSSNYFEDSLIQSYGRGASAHPNRRRRRPSSRWCG